jgi:flagellar hook assembly protein FlgD
MTLRRLLFLALAFAALAPAEATADNVRIATRDEPSGAVRSLAARPAPLTFTMVAVHWQGSGRVWLRTAREPGRWGHWRRADPEDEDRPDPRSPEARVGGWTIGSPFWTGTAQFVQYRTAGEVTRLRTYFIRSPVTDADRRAVLRSAPAAARAPAVARTVQPAIVTRSGWGANESIVREPPAFASRVILSIVHHTAGSNGYSAAQAAAIVRGIQRYHVLSNGWNDIGYNFLVDRFGRIYEGRGGGITRNVIGAHAEGFNTGSVGVAVIGSYGSSRISTAARIAVRRLLAWRLDLAHVDPTSHVDFVSYGNERYPAGTKVRLRAVSGHRNTGLTSCPGSALYGQLGALARGARGTGLPKLFDPQVTGSVGGLVRFTGRLSESSDWLVEVTDGAGAVVASGSGTGTAVDWTWDSTDVPFASYTYAISAGEDVRPATGLVPGPPPLAIRSLRVSPTVLTPNGDAHGEQATLSFRLTRTATVRVQVVDAASSAVRTLLPSALRSAGRLTVTWNGKTGGGAVVPDGRYRIEVSATSGAEQVSRELPIVVDRTLGSLSAAPTVVSPNGDGREDGLTVGFALTRPATVRVQVRVGKKLVRTLLSGSLGAGGHSALWDGSNRSGGRQPDGSVRAVVRATTTLGTRSLAQRVVVDTTGPRVRALSLRLRAGVARLRFSLSEPARVRVWLGRSSWRDGPTFVLDRAAGTQTLRRAYRARFARLVAVDAGQNRSAPALIRAGR